MVKDPWGNLWQIASRKPGKSASGCFRPNHGQAGERRDKPASLTMSALSSAFFFFAQLFLHTSPFTPASGLVRFL
jgi:hypothetical protein